MIESGIPRVFGRDLQVDLQVDGSKYWTQSYEMYPTAPPVNVRDSID